MLLHLWEPWYGWPSLQQVDGGSRDNGGQWQWAIAQTAWSLTRRNITDTLWPFPPFLRACVCKSGAHKAEQPHLWRVIKPQSGERGGEAAAKQESLRLRSFINRPSLPCGALTTWTTGAVSSDSDATNAPALWRSRTQRSRTQRGRTLC